MKIMKLSDYVWEYVEKLGVRHVFMLPGGGAMHLVDSLGKRERLQYVSLMHEQACTMAAETYARIDYGMGVVLVTTGPGGTNTLTGVAAAWLESTPILIISGQAKIEDLKDGYGVRQRGNQEIGIIDIVSSITKYAVMVKDPPSIRYHLEKAVYECTHGRQGPVWLDIPLDIQAAEVDVDEMESFTAKQEAARSTIRLKRQVAQTVELLKNAERPVIVAGQGIERHNGKKDLYSLVERLQIPILFSWMAVELLEFDHPCNMGKPGMIAPRYSNFTLQDSDLVLAIGTRLDPSMIGYDPTDFAPHARKIIVDIDPNELEKFAFDITCKVEADATEFIRELQRQMEHVSLKDNIKSWLLQCQRWKKEYPVVLDEFKIKGESINPYYFMDMLSDELDSDDVIVPGSSGANIDIFWLCIQNKRDQRLLSTGALGSMGYGIPAAIGACLASGRRTICVEGDGSLQLNIQELASIVGMKLPIKIFINGNGGYLSIMNMQRTHFSGNFVGANPESRLYLPNITAIAQAYGLKTYEIKEHSEVKEIIRQTLETEDPALCYVHMQNNVPIQPKVMSRVSKNGGMISGKLRNLWPFLEERA